MQVGGCLPQLIAAGEGCPRDPDFTILLGRIERRTQSLEVGKKKLTLSKQSEDYLRIMIISMLKTTRPQHHESKHWRTVANPEAPCACRS